MRSKTSRSPHSNESKYSGMKNKNLIFARKAAGFTQEGLAGKINVTPRSVNSWENGGEISVNHLIELYETFNRKYSMDFLLGYTEYTKIGNEEIGRLTGLSEAAINRLRQQKKDLDQWKDGRATSIIRMLNLILETEEGLEALQMIDNYVFADFKLTRFKERNIYKHDNRHPKRRLMRVRDKATLVKGKSILKDVSGTGLIQAKDRTTGNVQIFEAKHLANAFLGSVTECVVKLKEALERNK